MNIVTLTGKAGSGKSTALRKLAGSNPILGGAAVQAMLPALESKAIALAPETFVDEVSEALLGKLQKLSKTYPTHYTLFVCLQA